MFLYTCYGRPRIVELILSIALGQKGEVRSYAMQKEPINSFPED